MACKSKQLHPIAHYKLIIYTHIDFQMLLPSHSPSSPQDSARRSQRKTKRIDRDRFAKAYSKSLTPKRNKNLPQQHIFQSELHSYCINLMSVSTLTHEDFLMSEMEKAYREQCNKLFVICKIKLKQEEPLPPSLLVPPSPVRLIPSMEELPECESSELPVLEADSFPWQGLHRAQSAKMLCDNYENHELVYSVETLTPRLAREDLDFKFMDELQ